MGVEPRAPRDELAGRRVLVVEDEMLIACMVEDALNDLGAEVIGPVATLDAAMDLASHEALDAAVLDVTIRGGWVFPVADHLRTRRVPFVLASGYGDWTLPTWLRDHPRLVKPFGPRELEDQVLRLFEREVRPPAA